MNLSAGCALLLLAAATDTQSLCDSYRKTKNPETLAEIERRKEFTATEVGLIKRTRVNVGMTEKAMRCSWGAPQRSHRQATAAGVSTQHIYRDRYYIYVEKGVVVSWQD
jgi:hypothetical protein